MGEAKRKATPRKIKASPKGKTRGVKPEWLKPGWHKRVNARMERTKREENRLFAVFAGAILKTSLSMNQKVELLESVSIAIRDDRVRQSLEKELHKAERAYHEKPNKKTRGWLEHVRLDIAGLDGPDIKTIERYLGRSPTPDEIDQIERGVPFSTIVANIVAMQRLPSPSAQLPPAASPPTPPPAA
jgi:hypothetical protein